MILSPKKIALICICIIFVIVFSGCSNNTAETIVNNKGEIIMSKELSERQSNKLLENEEYLPIGTVVTVGDGTKKLMIIGLLQTKAENNQIYDYSAVLYPEGYISPNETYLFNKNQISRIYYLGYVSQEQKLANEELTTIVNSEKSYQ